MFILHIKEVFMKMESQDTICQSPNHIPTNEKIAYGMGAMMDGGGVALMSCVMLAYMSKALGIVAAMASTIMMIAKIWDAISDPLMGMISDNTRCKYGRRKPYMVVGGVLLMFSLFLLFAPIGTWGFSYAGKVAWMLIMYIVWNTCSTITQVPYTSMSGDISYDYKERNSANTVKLVFSAVTSGLAYVLPLLFLESLIKYVQNNDSTPIFGAISPVKFWIIMSVVFGVLFGGGLIACGLVAKERVKPDFGAQKTKISMKSFLKSYVDPFKNKSFKWHIVMYVTAFMCMDIISALAAFYALDVWHGVKMFGMSFSSMFIVAPLMVAAVIAFPLARYFMDKKSKQFAFRMGLPFYIAGGIMMAIMDPSWAPPILVPIVAFVMGLGFGGAQMMPWIIFPDTVDVAELKTGLRPTGNYSGIMTLVRKLAGALGVGMVGWVLTGVGYLQSEGVEIVQSSKVLLSIRLFLGLSICVLISIAMLASFKYKVNNHKLERIRYIVDKEKSGESLSEEEAYEKASLIKELA